MQRDTDTILHQDEVKTVVNAEITKSVKAKHAAIADLPAASGAYVQAEATATRNAVNGILATLRSAGIIIT